MNAETASVLAKNINRTSEGDSNLRNLIASFLSKEIVIGVVGYAGSGISYVADLLGKILEEEDFDVQAIKARNILETWATQTGRSDPTKITDAKLRVEAYQNIGDDLRAEKKEYGAVAGMMAMEVHKIRKISDEKKPQVFILDSLKHPAEVELLRQIYGEGFRLIGIGCRPDKRETRLSIKFHSLGSDDEIKEIIARDAEDSHKKNGQKVNKTFHLSDYFVDNTPNAEDTQNFRLPDDLKQVFEKLFTLKTFHPDRDEQGLYYADAAATSSACLSRQVGAAIIDNKGNLLSIGKNDVPKAGGGLYENSDNENRQGRCNLRGHCSNKTYQNSIANDIVDIFNQDDMPSLGNKEEEFRKALASTRMGSLIEFSRSVHAEMDALIALTRTGTQLPEDSTLFTTTYPCHNCARHIVAAGISRVVYLEPYKKSLAMDLHNDSIADNIPQEKVDCRVKFEPYIGVAPRLYQTIYSQSGERKDDLGNALDEENGRTLRSRLLTRTYSDLENECANFFQMESE